MIETLLVLILALVILVIIFGVALKVLLYWFCVAVVFVCVYRLLTGNWPRR